MTARNFKTHFFYSRINFYVKKNNPKLRDNFLIHPTHK